MLPRIRPKNKFKLNRRNCGDLKLKSPFFLFGKLCKDIGGAEQKIHLGVRIESTMHLGVNTGALRGTQ